MKKRTCTIGLIMMVLSGVAVADTLRIEVRDLGGMPISDVVIAYSYNATPPAAPGSGTVKTDSNGIATVVHPGLGGSSCLLMSAITYSISKPGFQFSTTTGMLPCGPATHDLFVTGTDLPKITVVSAASYDELLAGEMLTAAFGTNLAAFTQFAEDGSAINLADRTLFIKDGRGVEKMAQLLFVSPGQINFVMPSELAEGPVTIKLTANDGTSIGAQFTSISNIAPGVFSANSDGRGIAAAAILRVKPGNVQSYEPVAIFDTVLGKFVAAPIDLEPPSDVVYLALFGTGWRKTASVTTVIVVVSGVPCEVQYAGSQLVTDGLDQINVRLPRTLIGRGDVTVEVQVSGRLANPVSVNIK